MSGEAPISSERLNDSPASNSDHKDRRQSSSSSSSSVAKPDISHEQNDCGSRSDGEHHHTDADVLSQHPTLIPSVVVIAPAVTNTSAATSAPTVFRSTSLPGFQQKNVTNGENVVIDESKLRISSTHHTRPRLLIKRSASQRPVAASASLNSTSDQPVTPSSLHVPNIYKTQNLSTPVDNNVFSSATDIRRESSSSTSSSSSAASSDSLHEVADLTWSTDVSRKKSLMASESVKQNPNSVHEAELVSPVPSPSASPVRARAARKPAVLLTNAAHLNVFRNRAAKSNMNSSNETAQMELSSPPPHPFGPRSSLLRSRPSKRDLQAKTSQHQAPTIAVEKVPRSPSPIVMENTSKLKLHSLVERFARRATQVRDEIVWDEPPASSSDDEDDVHPSPTDDSPSKLLAETAEAKVEREKRQRAERQDEFRKRLEALAGNDMRIPPPADKNATPFSETVQLWGTHTWRPPAWLDRHFPRPFSTQTNYKFITWLGIVSIAFVYNAFAFPLRTIFDYDKDVPVWVWIVLDFISDLINVIDLVLVQPLVKVPEHGIFVSRRRDTAVHYVRSRLFIADATAIIPVDYVVWATRAIIHGKLYALLRVGRLCKFATYTTFFDRLDMVSSVPNALRIVKTMLYMLFLMHCNAGIYYVISKYEHTNNIYNIWTYNGKEIAYVRCFFYALKTGSDIGNNDPPLSVLERFYMTFCWLSGVFIFATLIEQIHGIVDNMHEREDEYRAKVNETIHYLQKMDIPGTTQERVRQWFAYNWHFQKTLNENEFIEVLPHKLKQDVALTVHYETLAKVELFQDCETELVRDLVLRLTPRLYLPGDFICKKGDVGHEMFIIKYGYAEVVGGPNNSTVFVTLGEGTVFGEIALLAVGGGNRRTADVRSKGISQLFVLKKHDLEAVIVDYPIAQRVLHKKAKRLVQTQKLKEQQAAAAASGAAGESGRGTSPAGSRQPKRSETDSIQPAHQTMADIVVQLLPVASEIRRRLSSIPNPSTASARSSGAPVDEVSVVKHSQNEPQRMRKRTVSSRKASSVSGQTGAGFATSQIPTSMIPSQMVNQPAPLSRHASFDSDYKPEEERKPDRKTMGEKPDHDAAANEDDGFRADDEPDRYVEATDHQPPPSETKKLASTTEAVGRAVARPGTAFERIAIYPLPPPR